MSLSGSLQVTEVSQLVNWARQGSRSGALHFEKGKLRKKLFFDKGRVVASASSVPEEWLGHFLVSRGLITELELAKAIEVQEESGMLLGSILVTIGGITHAQLGELLVVHCTEILCDLLTWADGTFEFHEGELPRGMVPAEIDIGKALLEGVRRLDDWRRIRRAIPDLGMVPIALGALEPPPDDPVAAQVFSRVDDDRSIEEIRLDSHTTEYAACIALTRAIEQGQIKLIAVRAPRERPAETAAKPAETPAGARPAPPDERPRISADELLECSADAARGGDFELARRYLEAARCLAGSDPAAQERVARIDGALHPRERREPRPKSRPEPRLESPPESPPESGPAVAAPARAPERTPQAASKPAYRSVPRFASSSPSTSTSTSKAAPAPPATGRPGPAARPAAQPAAPAQVNPATALDKTSVPALSIAPEDLMSLDLTPEEGFLISRIDGRMTLGELIKISPMPAEQAERAVSKLVAGGHVTLTPKA